MKYILSECKGKIQGETIIVEAENAKEACEKAGMTQIIRPYQRFEKMYFGKIYECRELDSPLTDYIAHR